MLRKIVNPLCNVYTIKMLRYAPLLTYLLWARTIKQSSSLNPVIQLSFWIAPIPKGWDTCQPEAAIFPNVQKDYQPIVQWLSNESAQICTIIDNIFCGLEPWSSVCPLKGWFLDDHWTKQMAGLEVRSSTIFDASSLRMQPIVQWLGNESAQICTIIDLSFAD